MKINQISLDNYIHHLDSTVIIEIGRIRIEKEPSLNDEYHKTQILKDLDLRFLRDIYSWQRHRDQLTEFLPLKDSLTLSGRNSKVLKMKSYTDHLNFLETRLDGSFRRYSKSGQLLIEGGYKNGLEDSIWKYYNEENEIIQTKEFFNGELIKVENYLDSVLLSEENFNTRIETIDQKYFHLSIIGLIILGLIGLLIWSYKTSNNKQGIEVSLLLKIFGVIFLPLIILFLAKMISKLIPDANEVVFIAAFIELILVYFFGIIILIIVFGIIRLYRIIDIVIYILICALIIVLIEEIVYLDQILI